MFPKNPKADGKKQSIEASNRDQYLYGLEIR